MRMRRRKTGSGTSNNWHPWTVCRHDHVVLILMMSPSLSCRSHCRDAVLISFVLFLSIKTGSIILSLFLELYGSQNMFDGVVVLILFDLTIWLTHYRWWTDPPLTFYTAMWVVHLPSRIVVQGLSTRRRWILHLPAESASISLGKICDPDGLPASRSEG